MPSDPLISIVVPAYNHEAYVADALYSALNQNYPNTEIIVVDDGSSDHTAEVAENVLHDGGRPYRLVRQENAGAHAALNRGMEAAEGEYIALLNSDDRYLPGRLRKLYNALAASGGRFAYSQVLHVDRIGFPHRYQAHYLHELEEAKRFPTVSFELLRENIAVTTGNFFFHRSLYEEIGGFAAYLACHDWDYILRVLLIEEPIFVPEPLLEYRIHAQGALQKHLDVVDQETAEIMLHYLSSLPYAKNPVAPGPVHWGKAWNDFSDRFLVRIRAFPEVKAQLDALRSEQDAPTGVSIAAGPLPEPPYCATPLDMPVDLDWTPVTLDIPRPTSLPKTRLRLLLLLPWLVMGGAERFALNLIDQLQGRKWEISIVCTTPSDNSWLDEFAKRTSDIVILPEVVPLRDYPRYLRYFIELREFDALLLQGSAEGYRLLPTLRALFPRLPLLDYLHFVTPDWMDGGYPRLSYFYRDALDLTFTSCDQVKRWMEAQGVPENRLRVCPIGVDPERWKPDAAKREQVRGELGIGPDEVALVYAARLEAQKQPRILAQTLHLLQEQGVHFRAVIAGDGSLRRDLETQLAEYRLESQAVVLGAVEADDMPSLLAAGDLFFLPSQNEGISAAIYEAMASGLPVVTADVGGQRELVTPECGLLLPSNSEEDEGYAYANALKELIEDAPRRASMGAASRQRILSGFTLDQMGERMDASLRELIQLKQDSASPSMELTEEQHLQRDTQLTVEYLQARRESQRTLQRLQESQANWEQARHAWEQVQEQVERECQESQQEWERKYVEARQQYDALSAEYFALLQPKPPSHWFYLWIRQLFLPLFSSLKNGRFRRQAVRFQQWLRRRLVGN